MTLRVVPTTSGSPPVVGRLNEDAIRLYEYAAAHPEGFTRPDVEQEFDWTESWFRIVEHRLRELLGEDKTETENLVCNPNPDDANGPWTYWLTDDVERTRIWTANRLDDSETRLETICSVARTAMRAWDARTRNGKRARAVFRNARRAIEGLALIDEAV